MARTAALPLRATATSRTSTPGTYASAQPLIGLDVTTPHPDPFTAPATRPTLPVRMIVIAGIHHSRLGVFAGKQAGSRTETHRYHKNEETLPLRSKEHLTGLKTSRPWLERSSSSFRAMSC